MRELKFRAWLVPYRQSDGKPSKRNKPYYDYFDLWNEYGDDTWFDGASVERFEQYTGLKDKNGKEIYEGDIVLEHPFDDEKTVTWLIRWNEKDLCFESQWLRGACFGDSMLSYEDEFEVIGNIHENPELILKAVKESDIQ